MLKHPRTELQDAMLARLRGDIVGVKNWSKNRFRRYWADEQLPAISVYATTERAEQAEAAPRRLKRTVQLEVEIVVASNVKADERMDELAWLAENAVARDETLDGKAADCVLVGSEITERTEGERVCGSIILVFEAIYRTWWPDEQALKTLEGIDYELKPGGAPDSTEALEGSVELNQ